MALVQLAQHCVTMEVAKLICKSVHGWGGVFWKELLNTVLNGNEDKVASVNFCCLGIGNLTVLNNISDRTKFSQNYDPFEELVV